LTCIVCLCHMLSVTCVTTSCQNCQCLSKLPQLRANAIPYPWGCWHGNCGEGGGAPFSQILVKISFAPIIAHTVNSLKLLRFIPLDKPMLLVYDCIIMPQMQMPGFTPASPIEPGDLDALIEVNPKPEPAEAETAATNSAPTKWEPKSLNPRHREIMRRLLEGANYRIIAEEMGLHVQTVMLVATSKMFVSELAKMEAEADFNVIK